MLKNYFKIAWRNLVKNKSSSIINIVGLGVGMAVAILIGLWIWDELSFNKHHQNYDSIAQIARKENVNGEIYIADKNNNFPIPLVAELRTSYGNYFKHVSLASPGREHVIAFDNNQFSRQGMYVEQDFLEIFTLKMIAGTNTALHDPNTILLTKSLALSLFGNADPIGKILKFDNKESLKVGGVFEDLPYNAKFSDISFFCPWRLLVGSDKYVRDNLLNNWEYSAVEVFVQAAPGISMSKISNSIRNVYSSKIRNQRGSNNETSIFLHPMKDWHLRSEWKNGVQTGGRIQMVWMFGIIGVFVLMLACINFINLSTARSEKRAKEVGIRKTIGSLRSQLVKQFLSESFLVVCFAFVLSLGIVLLSLNWFNEIADKKISFPFFKPLFWLLSITFIFITAFVSGSYPAFYLSSFQPVKVLKGAFRTGSFAAIPRRVMVGLQFTVSIILIIGTIIVYRQVQHGQNRPVGYDKNGLIRINMNTPDLYGKYDVLQKELFESGGAIGFAQSSSATTHINDFDGRFEWTGKDPNLPQMSFALMAVTYDFGKTIGWQFSQGRDFSKKFSTDASAIILNEAAIKFMRLKNPVGQTIKWNGKPYTVIGVIKDMITESPYEPVQQSAFLLVPNIGPFITIKLNPKLSVGKAIRKIGPIFRKLNPASPFDYKFVDEEYGRKFAAEQRIGTLASFFATLAIFISCLGIFGLASFIAERRTKEIGVRKVLGASFINLWGLLSKEFVLLVIIAFVIATPVAYYFMDQWLQKYDYHTSISWWMFGVAGAAALLITLLTVSFHAIKAAVANPVRSLRTE